MNNMSIASLNIFRHKFVTLTTTIVLKDEM